MLSNKIAELERENILLKDALTELGKRMEQSEIQKPKSCQYCKYFIQHYMKETYNGSTSYHAVYDGHCTNRVPIGKGRKRKPSPEDTCPFFEIGTHEMRLL